MKKSLLLLSVLFSSLCTMGQNHPPLAVDDVRTYRFDEAQTRDSIFFVSPWLLSNDSDPDNDNLVVENVVATSNAVLDTHMVNNILTFHYIPSQKGVGKDSVMCIIRDNGNPVMRDTSYLYIIIQYPTYDILDANNIRANVDKDALFRNNATGAAFEAPAGSGIHSIYAANLWVSGGSSNDFGLNVRLYGDSTYSADFSSNCGPINNTSFSLSNYDGKWDRVWKVKQSDIEYHLSNWNTANYSPPSVFLSWPAHGDTTIGEAYYLAPFVDYDSDGMYDPFAGDHPLIKGDQAIYFIYNDGISGYSYHPVQSEVHGMAYAFQCDDSALQNTVFVDYKIINRSNNTYDSTYFGLWADMDLGNAQDDYLQCDVDRSLFFTLNGDDFDENHGSGPGYGAHVPAQACMILKGAKQDNDGQDNAFGIGTNETVNGIGFGDGLSDNEHWGMQFFRAHYGSYPFANTEFEFYNYLRGKNDSGAYLSYDFLQNGNPIRYNYVYPDSSDSYHYGTGGIAVPNWSEATFGNPPSDQKGVSSTGPVTFAPGDEIELTYAFVFGRDYINTGAQAGVTNMLERADSIRSYYNQGMLTACGFPVSVKESVEVDCKISVYPNPAKNTVNIRQDQAEHIQIEVLDVTGKVVLFTNSSNQLTQVDISGLTNGVYLIRVSSKEKTYLLKFVKN